MVSKILGGKLKNLLIIDFFYNKKNIFFYVIDYMITCPVNYMVDKFSENGNSVYYYFFKEVKYTNVHKFNKYIQ